MGSVGKHLYDNDCVAVIPPSVPRKLRSATKKRDHDSISTPHLPISRKRNHTSNGIEKHKKHDAKKSKLNMGHVTKDEKEVAETLNALASMFSDATKGNTHLSLADKPQNVASRKQSIQTSSKAVLDAAKNSSNLLDSRARVEQPSKTNAFGVKSSLSLSTRIPTWFENTNFASQPRGHEYSVSADKYPEASVESKKSWKRCATQVYICRLIQVLQISEKKEGSLEKPGQLAACGDPEIRPSSSTYNQTRGIHEQQIQFPPYPNYTINSSYMARIRQQMEPHQQKLEVHFPSQYNGGGVAAKSYLPEWRIGEMESLYGRGLFPRLNSAIGANCQPFSLP